MARRRFIASDERTPTATQAAHIARLIDAPDSIGTLSGATRSMHWRCQSSKWVDGMTVTPAGYAAIGREVPAALAEPETCDHYTGQVGCALPTCDGVPVGVDVHTAETVAAEPVGYESGHAAFGRDLTHAMRRTGLVVTLPTTFESRWDRGNVRKISGYDLTANGHAVRVLSYESRGSLSTCGMSYAAVYVDGQLISSEQPMWGGAAKVGHAIAYAVACHVDTLRAAKVAAERAEVPAPAEPVAEVADFAGAVDLAEVPAEIGAEVPEVAAEPEPVAGGQRRGYGRTVTRTVTNRREGGCDWCGVMVPAGRGEARLLDVGGWVVVHPDSRWQGSPVSGGYVGGCPKPEVAEPVGVSSAEPEPVSVPAEPVAAEPEPVAEVAAAAEVDRRAACRAVADAVAMGDTARAVAVVLGAEPESVPESVPEPVAEVPAVPEPERTPLSATVDRDSLADALAFVGKSIPRRPSVPVLSGVMLSAEGGRVTVAAFDYDSAREVDVPADDVTAGRVLIGYKSLADVVKKLPKRSRVNLAEVGAAVAVECGRVRLSLPTMPAEDYPTLPAMPDKVGTLPVQAFADMVLPVALSAGTDETMPKLTGVRVEADGRTLAMMSTDRYRLGIRETAWSGDAFGAIVPARMLAEVATRYAKIKGGRVTVGCEVTGEGVRFGMVCERYRVNLRTLDDGSGFVPVRSLVPAEGALVADATVDAADMLGAIERAATACERTAPVRLTFAGGEVTVAGGGGDSAQVAEPVACDWSGGELTIAFNPAYLADGVKAAGTDRVRFRFVSHDRAALIVPAGEGVYGPGDLYLIMPIKACGSWVPPVGAGPVAEVVAEPEPVAPVAEVAAEPVADSVPEVAAEGAEPEPVAEPVGVDVDRACRSLTQRARHAANLRGSDSVRVRYSVETGRVSVKGARPDADMVSAVFGRAYRFDRTESPAYGGHYSYYMPVTAEPVAEVPAEPVAEVAEPVAEPAGTEPEPVAVSVPEVPADVADVAEPVAESAAEVPARPPYAIWKAAERELQVIRDRAAGRAAPNVILSAGNREYAEVLLTNSAYRIVGGWKTGTRDGWHVCDLAPMLAEPEQKPEPVSVPETGAEIMARVLDAYAAGDLAGALAAVAEGETVAPGYRSAGASGVVYGWADMRASLPAEPVAPVAEPAEVPAEVAEVAEPVADMPAEPEPDYGVFVDGVLVAVARHVDLTAEPVAEPADAAEVPAERVWASWRLSDSEVTVVRDRRAGVSGPAGTYPAVTRDDAAEVLADAGYAMVGGWRADPAEGSWVCDLAEVPAGPVDFPMPEPFNAPATVAEPVAEPVGPEVTAEPEPVPSAMDAHAAILAQLGRAGSLAATVPAPVRVTVPDTAAAVVAGWNASDLPVPVSPAAPVAEPVAVSGPVPVWTYPAGTRVRATLKEARPDVAGRMRDGGVKVGRVSIVPDRDARAVAVTLDGVAEGDAPRVWAIVAEVMAGHGFAPAEVSAEV